MDRLQRFLIRQRTSQILLYSGIVFTVGVFVYGISLYIQSTLTPDDFNLWAILLKDLSLVLIGASVVTLLFGWATKAELITVLSSILNQTLDKTLTPSINHLSSKSIKYFRWESWIGKLSSEIGNLKDSYLYQNITVSYMIPEIEEDIRMVFAVGNKDGILRDYFSDERYVVKYKIECYKDELDIMDEKVCRIHAVKINNELLAPASARKKMINGSNAKEYIYAIPDRLKTGPVLFSVTYSVLKWVRSDKRIFVAKQIFETTEDAEFRLFVSNDLNVESIVADTTEMTSFSPNRLVGSYTKTDDLGNDVAASIICRYPLLSGSSVRFELQVK